MKFHRVPVHSVERAGRYFILRYPWDGPVEPGQFVMARAAGSPVTLDPFLARPLSFFDHDGETASLLFEVRGRGTELLAKAKDEVEVTTPLGKSFRAEGLEGARNAPRNAPRAALLGGGVGVAPFKFLSRRLSELGIDHRVFLGFADSSFAGAADDFPGATLATMDGSAGVHGTVLDAVEKYGGMESFSAVYACGPNPMLAAVKLATPKDVLCQVSVEERMGCGNGSCNGCVVPIRGRGYVRSCIEGPVFDAEALAW